MDQKKLKKVLFVDDDVDILQLLQYSLEATSDLEIVSAHSGEEALETAQRERPDLIVLDVMMPGMDGPTTLTAIRALPGLDKVPVIFLTGKTAEKEINAFLSLGAIDVLVKPFDPTKIESYLLAAWKKHLLSE